MLKIVSRNSGQVTLYIILTLYNAFGVKMGAVQCRLAAEQDQIIPPLSSLLIEGSG